MNMHDEMSDNEVLRTAAGALSALPVPEPPDARAIMARGRTRGRRRLAGIGLAGTAAAAAAALSLASVLAGAPAPALATGTIRTAAFTLVKNTNGTATLTLSLAQTFNPRALQQALAQDGIPALIKIGAYCSSQPAPHPPDGMISDQLPDGTPVAKGPGRYPVPPDAVVVINPALVPAGTELSFDYLNNGKSLTVSLIHTDSYTCVNGLP